MAYLAAINAKIPVGSNFTIKEVPGKGFGAFTTRDVKKGELILAEKPLMRIDMARYVAADVEAVFSKLSNEQKAAYMSLASAHGQDPARYPKSTSPFVERHEKTRIREQHDARTGDEKTVLSVCITNAMQVEDGAGIFELASRFNHECVPNACFSWDEGRQIETIYAVQDIAEGEEITLCYCDPWFDISMRRWELQHYGFECTCKACVDIDTPGSFGAASRERRWKLRELNQQLRVVANDQERLEVRLEMIAAMTEEGFCLPAMGDMYLEVARICERSRDIAMAVKAARKALENYVICYGSENERSRDAAKSVRAFEKQLPKGVFKK